ncbi:MAG: HD domain-containing protein [Zoogloea sp.]|uniref:HD domain-containing phosphohydrolase n=1 Tax=Zoogloea sp. TaxID=49181 RepID=UPI0026067FED|nr:HD domain-containing phosphohydrolase [Zoogloea sp.]MDD3329406.1 HD domain-containing protein [Zoogloea sp.]
MNNGHTPGTPRTARRALRLPLHIHIATLFFWLVLATGASIAWMSYTRSVHMLEHAAERLTERAAAQTLVEIEALLYPAGTAVRLAALERLTAASTLAERRRSLPFLQRALLASPAVSSIYAGYGDGDFFLLFRIVDDEARKLLAAPPGARWMVQSIEQGEARFIHLDDALKVLRDDPRPDFAAGYDPRQRGWYRAAAGAAGLIYTAPYLFATTAKAGVTVAQRSEDGRAVVGADIRLASLGATLQRLRITPASQLVLLDEADRVVAASEEGGLKPTAPGAAPEAQAIDALGGPLAALAAQARRPGGEPGGPGLIAFSVDGRDWRGALLTLRISGGPQARLGIVVPDDELLTDAITIRDRALLATLLVMLGAVPLTYLAARLVSKPIRELADEAAAIRRFDFAADVETRSVVREVDDLATDLASMKASIRHFLELSESLAEESSFDRLLPRLVDETVAVSGARAGVLYLAGDEEAGLEPATLRAAAGQPLDPALAPPGAAMAGLAGEGARSGGGSLDAGQGAAAGCGALFGALGRPGMAYLALPLLDRDHARVGLLVLWFDEAPGDELVHFVEALSGTAALSVETRALIRSQKRLFESFLQLLAHAIDAKSRYTGGHCARVPVLTKMLARAACDATSGPFRDFALGDDGWETLHVAAWLHDCGKVTTPEFIVDKATKLETLYDRIHEIRMRFEVLKRDATIACCEAIIAGEAPAAARARLADALAALDADFAFVAACNAGGEAMAPGDVVRLQQIAGRRWLRTLDDRLGVSPEELRRKGPAQALPVEEALLADKPEHLFERPAEDRIAPDNPWGLRMTAPALLANRGELANLAIARGTLTTEDRYRINEHIVNTIRMLADLPFPRHLRAVPEIAGSHHEKMDGSGYPRGLTGAQMSPLARMLAIADIFEALTAVDRPYKQGKRLSEAVAIMASMRDAGHIDPALFALFLESGVYRDYARRFMQPACIDEVDVAAILAKAA